MDKRTKEMTDFDWGEYDALREKAVEKCRILKSARTLYHYYEKNPNTRYFKDVDVPALYRNGLEETIIAVDEYIKFLSTTSLSAQKEQMESRKNELTQEFSKLTDQRAEFFKNQT